MPNHQYHLFRVHCKTVAHVRTLGFKFEIWQIDNRGIGFAVRQDHRSVQYLVVGLLDISIVDMSYISDHSLARFLKYLRCIRVS